MSLLSTFWLGHSELDEDRPFYKDTCDSSRCKPLKRGTYRQQYGRRALSSFNCEIYIQSHSSFLALHGLFLNTYHSNTLMQL